MTPNEIALFIFIVIMAILCVIALEKGDVRSIKGSAGRRPGRPGKRT